MLGTGKGSFRDFARFVALSGGGWIVDTLILLALVGWAHAAPQIANLVSASIAATLVYSIAHRRIHGGARHGIEVRLGLYLVYTALIVILASLAMAPLTATAAATLGTAPAGIAAAFVAKCLVTPPQLLCNFLVSRTLARSAQARPGA